MEEVPVVTVFLRHRGEVLLFRRSENVGSYAGRWGTVTGHLDADSPTEAALDEINEETGLTERDVSLVRKGPSFEVVDDDRGTRWIIHPFLFDAATRSVTPNWETDEAEWAAPTVLLRRDTVPELWTSYRRVAPSLVSLTDDTTHGSTYLSLRALEVLRDRAGVLLATTETADIEDARARLVSTAHRLLDARPSMAALANRIHRVMHASRPELAPHTVEINAHEAIGHALDAQAKAIEATANVVDDQHVLTLSRSGTVLESLRTADPVSVTVLTSHPGGEGVGIAEALFEDDLDVSLCPDAAGAAVLSDGSIDLVLVGADTVHPSGAVVNKVGTRGLAVAADHEDVPFYVACTADKASVDPTGPTESVDRRNVYEGPDAIDVWAPRFDVAPPSLVTGGFLTDRGPLALSDLAPVVDELERLRTWM